jgi:hypothetical protein
MEVESLNLKRLHNEEHFKYLTDFNELVLTFTAAVLDITAEHSTFIPKLKNEKEALGLVRKSSISDKLTEADIVRDTTIRGIKKVISGSLHHFNADVRDAAGRLIILFDSFGDITAKSYEQETGAILKLTADLKGSYAADVTKLGISDWITELEENNDAFNVLMKDRFNEKDEKTRLRMKQVRTDIDKVYLTIVKRINALIIVNGETEFIPFVNKLNLVIKTYANNLALRKGKKKAASSASGE